MKKKRKEKEGATNGISLVMLFARISNPFKRWQWHYVDLDNIGGFEKCQLFKDTIQGYNECTWLNDCVIALQVH